MAQVSPGISGGGFSCVIALCLPDGQCHTFDGELRGLILDTPTRIRRLWLRPSIFDCRTQLTLAELPMEIKNAISHRGTGFAQLKAFLAGSESE